MLDWAATQIPTLNTNIINIGNEVDIYLNANPQEWPAWQVFFEQTSAHARTLWPNAVIGCKATYAGLINEPSRTALAQLNQSADGLFATYYATEADLSVSPSGTTTQSMTALVQVAGDKPVYILEHGCPSSALLGSSEAIQASFITETFTAWDNHADSIRQIDFFALHDFTRSWLLS